MRYVVIGGGTLGLLVAYLLVQAGQSVMVFEQEQWWTGSRFSGRRRLAMESRNISKGK